MEEVKEVSLAESEKLQGIISMLSVGDIKCDKCGKTVHHMDRYCNNTRQCHHHKTAFNTIAELNSHFIEEHSPEPARGIRYCLQCSIDAGYLQMVKNKKSGDIYPAMLILRDEEPVLESPEPVKPAKKTGSKK